MKLSLILNDVKSDYFLVVGFLAAVGQFSFVGKLISKDTASHTIYGTCLLLFALMVALATRYLRRARRLRLGPAKRRLYRVLTVMYATLAVLALVPAAYRWAYLYTPLFKEGTPTQYRETGRLFGVSRASAQTVSDVLTANMALDPTRTSMQCVQVRPGIQRPKEIAYRVVHCAAYAISGERAGQLMGATRASPDPSLRTNAFEALKHVATYRIEKEPLLERGPELVSLFNNPEWKGKLIHLLPNLEEWKRLKSEYPILEESLRRFVLDWVGLLDPIFRVSFANTGGEPIQVTTLRYTATRLPPVKALLFGAYETPRYRLVLKEGTHEEDLVPPIVVPRSGVQDIDLLIQPERPSPGIGFELRLQFLSADAKHSAAVPGFTVRFFKASP